MTSLKVLPFHSDRERDEEGDGVGDVVERVDDLGPDVDVDGRRVGDQLESLFQAVLQHGEGDKDRVENAEHHNQLKKVSFRAFINFLFITMSHMVALLIISVYFLP